MNEAHQEYQFKSKFGASRSWQPSKGNYPSSQKAASDWKQNSSNIYEPQGDRHSRGDRRSQDVQSNDEYKRKAASNERDDTRSGYKYSEHEHSQMGMVQYSPVKSILKNSASTYQKAQHGANGHSEVAGGGGYSGMKQRGANAEVTDGYTEYFSHGCDFMGQLGHGQDPNQHDKQRYVCIPKSLSFDILINEISCGAQHTMLLSKAGELFTIGSNQYGQLGLNDTQLEFTTAPLLVQEIQQQNLHIISISSGRHHNLIQCDNGLLFSWGANHHGQCGQDMKYYQTIFQPQRVIFQGSAEMYVVQVDCGDNFSGFLDETGSVYTFGDNSQGQLGIASEGSFEEAPKKVQVFERIQSFSLGYRHQLLLSSDGSVFGAGLNQNFQLGLGTNHMERIFSMPIRIDTLNKVQIEKVVAGGFSAALTRNGQVLLWGEGDFGTFKSPQRIYMDSIEFSDCQISKFRLAAQAMAVDKQGKVYAWGSNNLGQLGLGDERNRKLPTSIQQLKRKKIKKVSLGDQFTIMLGRDVSLAEQQLKKQKKQMKQQQLNREASAEPVHHMGKMSDARPYNVVPNADLKLENAYSDPPLYQHEQQQLPEPVSRQQQHASQPRREMSDYHPRHTSSQQQQDSRIMSTTMDRHSDHRSFDKQFSEHNKDEWANHHGQSEAPTTGQPEDSQLIYGNLSKVRSKNSIDQEQSKGLQNIPSFGAFDGPRDHSGRGNEGQRYSGREGAPSARDAIEPPQASQRAPRYDHSSPTKMMDDLASRQAARSKSGEPYQSRRINIYQGPSPARSASKPPLDFQGTTKLRYDDIMKNDDQQSTGAFDRDSAGGADIRKSANSAKLLDEIDERTNRSQSLLNRVSKRNSVDSHHQLLEQRSGQISSSVIHGLHGQVSGGQLLGQVSGGHLQEETLNLAPPADRQSHPQLLNSSLHHGSDRYIIPVVERSQLPRRTSERHPLVAPEGRRSLERQQEQEQYRAELSQMQKKYSLLEKEKETISQLCQQLQNQVDIHKNDYDLMCSNQQKALRENDSLQEQLEFEKRNAEMTSRQNVEFIKQIEKLKQQFDQQQDLIREKDEQIDLNLKQIRETEAQVNDLSLQLNQERDETARQNDDLAHSAHQHKLHVDDLNEKLAAKERRLNHQFEQMKEDEQKIKQLEAKIKENEAYIEDMLKDNSNLKEDLRASQNEAGYVKAELEKQDNKLKALEEEKSLAQNQNEEHMKEVRELDVQMREMRTKLEEVTLRSMEEKRQIEEQLHEMSQKHTEISHLLNQRNLELQRMARSEKEYQFLNDRLAKDKVRLEQNNTDLVSKNRQLGDLLDKNMFNRAETYKNKILETLSRPRGNSSATPSEAGPRPSQFQNSGTVSPALPPSSDAQLNLGGTGVTSGAFDLSTIQQSKKKELSGYKEGGPLNQSELIMPSSKNHPLNDYSHEPPAAPRESTSMTRSFQQSAGAGGRSLPLRKRQDEESKGDYHASSQQPIQIYDQTYAEQSQSMQTTGMKQSLLKSQRSHFSDGGHSQDTMSHSQSNCYQLGVGGDKDAANVRTNLNAHVDSNGFVDASDPALANNPSEEYTPINRIGHIGEVDLMRGQSKVGEQLAMTLTGKFRRDSNTMSTLDHQQQHLDNLGTNVQSFGNTPHMQDFGNGTEISQIDMRTSIESRSAVGDIIKSPIEDQLRKIESILNKDKA